MWAIFGQLVAKLLIGLALAYVAYLLAPKPEPPKAGTLDDFGIPHAEEGTEAGILFGTSRREALHVHWYGDLKTVPIKEKAK